jgi:hypothetical protein
MHSCRYLLILLIVPACALHASAGLFDKRAKPEPSVRVPELIGILKTEQDERKRSTAVQELRQYDPRSFPEMIPALVDVLQNDARPGLRLEAMHSLSTLRPVSQIVGEALEQTAANDKSLRVRLQARTTLISYHWSGYNTPKKTEATVPVTPGLKRTEPPLVQVPPSTTAPRGVIYQSPTNTSARPPGAETAEPPLAPAPPLVQPSAPLEEGPMLMPPR